MNDPEAIQLRKDFIAFCESKPSDEEINHYSWDTCAVGEFASDLGIDNYEVNLEDTLFGNNKFDTRLALNEAYTSGELETYGVLTSYLKQQFDGEIFL